VPDRPAWHVIGQVDALVHSALATLGRDFALITEAVAVHRSAEVARSADLTGPVILGPRCRVGPGAVRIATTSATQSSAAT
jgi:UDP-N-acetylglucosamine diphosphorylase / glucose-1-phosphate thymidylyltransferase / UDP-N-acetylgalactosamine diphosphorylase / glucosamine-1-phosphate N-acetyltransferase / galactosamine-1-phosphate N-acetyltransferase